MNDKSTINLSYIIVTYNKLSYLKDALTKLLAHKKDDEEIIVIDGGSTDGSAEYVREMFTQGNIQQYVSEKDKGLGHAINKGLLMAKGTVIKTMSDDDIYYYDEMQKCKKFLLEHSEIDVLGTNGIDQHGNEYHREEDFLQWKNTTYHPFMIAELGLWLRTSSLPILGLADPSFFFWDGEFTIRITAGKKARLAWYTGLTWEHPLNSGSVSLTKSDVWESESARLRQMYPNLYSKWKQYVPKPIRTLIRHIKPKKQFATTEIVTEPTFLF